MMTLEGEFVVNDVWMMEMSEEVGAPAAADWGSSTMPKLHSSAMMAEEDLQPLRSPARLTSGIVPMFKLID